MRGRMVVLNTNLYYDQNDETAGEEDPGGQFRWLEETLTNASRADEMVLKRLNKQPGLLPSSEALPALLPLGGVAAGWCSMGSVGSVLRAALSSVGLYCGACAPRLL